MRQEFEKVEFVIGCNIIGLPILHTVWLPIVKNNYPNH